MYRIQVALLYEQSLEGGAASHVIFALRACGAAWWVAWRFV